MFKDHEVDWLENDVLLFHVVPTFRFPSPWQCWYFRRRLYSHLTIQNLPTAPIWGPIKYHHKSDVMRVARQRTRGLKTGRWTFFPQRDANKAGLWSEFFKENGGLHAIVTFKKNNQNLYLKRQSLIVVLKYRKCSCVFHWIQRFLSRSIIYQGMLLLSTLLFWPFLILKTAKFQYFVFKQHVSNKTPCRAIL